MIYAILKIRICQARRIVNDLGLGRVIFVFLMLAGLLYQLFIATKGKPDVATLICLLLVLFLHLKRKDLLFLKSHVERNKMVLLIEYLILSLPLLAGLSYYLHWLFLAGYLTVLTLIVQIGRQLRKHTFNSFIQRWIPDDCFEWKSGVRKSLFYILPIWLTGLGISFWPGTVPIVMIVLGIFFIGFFEKNEPLNMLLVYEMGATKLLRYKILRSILIFSIVVFPLMVVYLIIHPDYWYFPLIFYTIVTVILTYAILCKYAFYRPDISTGNQVFTALGPVSIFVSFLIPLILILSLRFYFKSVNNLNQYLNDFN